MSEPIAQWEIHHETRNHLTLVAPLLERIGSGSASQVGVGYVERDKWTDERFTDAGWSTVKALRTLAYNSAAYLWDVSGETTGDVDARLLNDVQGFFAVLACALLLGMDKDARLGAHPPWVATGLLNMLHALQGRLGEEPDRWSSPATEKAPATTTEDNGSEAVSEPGEPREPTKPESDRDDADPPTKRWPGPVGEPIAASSDEGALFEPIYSTGGRMPEA